MSISGTKLRLLRTLLLVAAVAVLQQTLRPSRIGLSLIQDLFPQGGSLRETASGLTHVLDRHGERVGMFMQTLPDCADIIGYSGPSDLLIAMNRDGGVIAVRVLSSRDTPEHVAEVVAHRDFFAQFKDRLLGQPSSEPIHAVSGATLTSTAMAESINKKLGAKTNSLRFPEDITLAEVQAIEPSAGSLLPSKSLPSAQEVLGKDGSLLGLVLRSSPVSDTLNGYQGPSDLLLYLDPSGQRLRRLSLRRSYDTEAYVGYVTGDAAFLQSFARYSVPELAKLDFAKAGIEGVSGATATSYGVAEAVRQRSAALLAEQQTPVLRWLDRIRWRGADAGHAIMLLSALLMAFSRLRGITWMRHLHHALLVGYGGFMLGELMSLSLLTGWGSTAAPWRTAPGLVMLAAVALLAPIFTRRQLYCHHICPHGALQSLLQRRLPWQWQPSAAVSRWLGRLPWLLLALAWLAVTGSWGWNLNALEPFDAYLPRVAGYSALTLAVLGLIGSAFTPMAYCKYGCPTGALFKLIRYAGESDRWSRRDSVALTLIAVGWLLTRLG
jgi:NosR/NirI family transcriptional regulator, nitrous oxide reductase regulator